MELWPKMYFLPQVTIKSLKAIDPDWKVKEE